MGKSPHRRPAGLDSSGFDARLSTMKLRKSGVFPAVVAVASFWCAGSAFAAGGAKDLVREALLQQGPAQRVGCTGVQRTLVAVSDATLVVRTAVELGYDACQVIRCALEGKAGPEQSGLCEKVIRGAALAGVLPDVISRCSEEFCDPAGVATILGDAFLEPNYCYFAGQPLVAPEVDPPQMWVIDRSPPQAQSSPFRF